VYNELAGTRREEAMILSLNLVGVTKEKARESLVRTVGLKAEI
jgi:hypothetical protein